MSAFHPAFIARIQHDSFIGQDLLEALESTPPVSIRKHPVKAAVHFEEEQVIPWCSHGFHLSERPLFTLEPLFHAGCFYPQEAGSMLLEWALKSIDLPDNPKILDLCAAPGGKSNEVIRSRSRILQENMTKWGYSNGIVTNNDPADFQRLPGFFDVIVVDAPCSGEGMFRKDPQARDEWSPENVDLCAARQKRIVADVWEALQPGGILIYSTCTFNEQENEDNVRWITEKLGGERVSIPIPESFVAGRSDVGVYGIPGRSKTEGFFLAVIRKSGRSTTVKFKKGKTLIRQKDLLDSAQFAHLDDMSVFFWNNQLLAVPKHIEADFLMVQQQLHIVKWGTNIGEIARKGIIPHHELAMTPSLRKIEQTIEVDRHEALRYLHGDTFSLDGKQGFTFITHQQEPLGWIKHLGNRFNNLYPKEWRIRMDVG